MRRRWVAWMFAGLSAAVIGGLCWLVFLSGSEGQPGRWDRAYSDMHNIQKALLRYKLKHASFPEDLDELELDYFPNGVPRDTYTKEAYLYTTDGRSFSLVSYGKDGAPGGEHPPERDIVYTEGGCLTPYN